MAKSTAAKTVASSQKKAPVKATRKKAASGKAASKAAGAKKPAAKKPAAKQPVARKPAAKKPAAKKPATGKTASSSKKTPAKKAPAKKTPAKKAAAKTAPKAKPVFDKKFLDRQTKLLLAEREKYFQSSINLESEAQQLLETREQGDVQFDEESAQGDSWAIEREQDLILSAGARATVEKIDAALARIENGTYGICEKTGKPIPKARLQAIPWATKRVEQRSTGLLLR